MPTQGSNIPVLTVEKFWLDSHGRGIYAHGDGYAACPQTWNGVHSGNTTSGYLPAASTTAWLKLTIMSGTNGAAFTGFIPVFSGNIIPGKGL